MISEAYISGQIGRAVYREDERFYLIRADEAFPVECRLPELSLFFNSGAEFTDLSAYNPGIHEITKTLLENTTAHRALFSFISGLDEESDAQTRCLFIEAAEEFFQSEQVRAFVKNRMLARPKPEDADIRGAIDLAEKVGAGITANLYREVLATQEAAGLVRKAWEQIAPDHFTLVAEQTQSEAVLIEAGVFAYLAEKAAANNRGALKLAAVEFGNKPEIKRRKGAIQIINSLQKRLLLLVPSDSKAAVRISNRQ